MGPVPIIKSANIPKITPAVFGSLCLTGYRSETAQSNRPRFATVAASVLLNAMDFELNQRIFAVEPPRIDTWKTLRWAWPQRQHSFPILGIPHQWDPVVHCLSPTNKQQLPTSNLPAESRCQVCKPNKSDFETLHLSVRFHMGPLFRHSF